VKSCLIAFFLIIISFLVPIQLANADGTWSRFPADGEIEQARQKFLSNETYTKEPCIVKCQSITELFEQQMCLGDCRLNLSQGQGEIIRSEISDTRIIKLYNPSQAQEDPLAASRVVLSYTLKRTYRYTDGAEKESITYQVATLSYQNDPLYKDTYQTFYFNSSNIFYCTEEPPIFQNHKVSEMRLSNPGSAVAARSKVS